MPVGRRCSPWLAGAITAAKSGCISEARRNGPATPTCRTTFGTATNHNIGGTSVVIAPGSPEGSQLFVRMASQDPFTRRPFLATDVVDANAVQLIREWIEGLRR